MSKVPVWPHPQNNCLVCFPATRGSQVRARILLFRKSVKPLQNLAQTLIGFISCAAELVFVVRDFAEKANRE
jgi:hypothetical protein